MFVDIRDFKCTLSQFNSFHFHLKLKKYGECVNFVFNFSSRFLTLETRRKLLPVINKKYLMYLKCSVGPQLLNALTLDLLQHVEKILKQNCGF